MQRKYTWSAVLVLLALVGAGCGGCGDSGKTEGAVALVEGFKGSSANMANYSVQERDGKKVLTDGECLIYIEGENKILSAKWQKNTDTEKIGNHTFNTTKYLENTYVLRMDAHLLSSEVRLSLDNPAGFTRCVEDFRKFLETVEK